MEGGDGDTYRELWAKAAGDTFIDSNSDPNTDADADVQILPQKQIQGASKRNKELKGKIARLKVEQNFP